MANMRIIFILFLLASCSRTITHGVILNERDTSAITPNLTRQEDVRTLLGNPSFKWNEKWYYASTKKRYKAFFLPNVEKHDVYEIAFENGVVSQMKHFTQIDIKNTQVSLHEIEIQKPNLSEMFR
jgi:outer membrane protein assembly factor BamE (lipoprotein component of BamABCDE complex)